MKNILLISILVLAAGVFASCEYDNFDKPSSHFSGRIVYKGEQLAFEYDNPYMELWEQGWDKKSAIRVNLGLDGTFSQMLFDGTYKMVFPKSRSPFVYTNPEDPTTDTLTLVIKGNKTMDIEVTPYFMIRDEQFRYNPATDKMEASCKVEQIITDPSIARNMGDVRVYVGKTAQLYQGSQINWHTLNMGNNPGGSIDNWLFSGPVVKKADFPTAQNYCYVRISTKPANTTCWISTPVKKYFFD